MSRALAAGLIALTMCFAAVSRAEVATQGSTVITGISVSETAQETVVTIKASSTPTFSVFKLEDPVRLFVDVSQGDVSPVDRPVIVDNGVLERVGTLQFKSHGVPVGRVILGLEKDAAYDIRAEGDRIVVRIDGEGRRPSDGEANALSQQVETIRAQIDQERALLSELKSAREREAVVKAKETESRREAERLRIEADKLKELAQKNQQEAVASSESARKEQVAIQASIEKARERKQAEETAALRAAEAATAAQAAVNTEKARLEAIRTQRIAEESHREAIQKLAVEEKAKAEDALQARVREEAIIAQLAETKAKLAKEERRKEQARVAELNAKIDGLQAALNSERSEVSKAKETRDTATRLAAESVKSSEVELAKARNNADELKARLARAIAEQKIIEERAASARQLSARLSAERTELAAVSRDKDEAEARSTKAKKAYDATLIQLRSEEERLSALAKQRQDAEVVISKLRMETQELETRRAQIETAETRALRNKIEAQDKELANLRLQYESDKENLKANYEARLSSALNENANKDATIHQLTERFSKASSDVDRVSEEVGAKEQEIAALKAALATEKAGAADQTEIDRLTKDLFARESQLKTVRDELAGKLVESERLANERYAEINRLSAMVKTLQASQTEARDEAVADLQQSLKSREIELSVLKRAYEDTKKTASKGNKTAEDRLAKLKARVTSQETEMAALRKEINSKLAQSKSALAERESRIAALSQQVESLKQAGSQKLAKAVAELRSEVQSKESEVAQLKGQYEALRRDGASDGKELNKARGELAKATKSLMSYQEKLANAHQREQLAIAKEAKAASRIEELMASIADTRREVALESEKARLAEVKANKATATADLARREAEKAKAEAERAKAELARLQAENARMKTDGKVVQSKAASVATAKAEKATRAAETARKEADKARIQAEMAQAEVEKLKNEGAKSKAETQEILAKAERTRLEAVKAQAEVARLKSELDSANAADEKARRTMADLGKARNEAEKARFQAENAQAEVEKLKIEGAKSRAQAQEILAKEERTRLEAVKAQAEVARLKSELESARADQAKANQASAVAEQARASAEQARLLAQKAQAEVERIKSEGAEFKAEAQKILASAEKIRAEANAAKQAQVAKAPVEPAIRSIDFKETSEGPSLVMNVSGHPDYAVTVGDDGYVMTFDDVKLPGDLARRMDVTAFDSDVSMVSAFTDNDGKVRLIVDLKKLVGQKVRMADGVMTWTFAGPSPKKMMAGAAPTPSVGSKRPMLAMNTHMAADNAGPATEPAVVPEMSAQEGDGSSPFLRPSMIPKKKKYRGKRINLTVKDADIQNVLTFLAREGKVNIVTSETVTGKVTFHLEDVPWDLALDTVLKAKGLDYVIEQGIYRVALVETIKKEFEDRVEKQQKMRELKPVIVRLIPINYGDGREMAERLKAVLSSAGMVSVDKRTNTLVVKDTEDYLKAAEDLVHRLDQQTPQILIEARIVEARTTFKEDIGVQWGGKFAMASAYGTETGLVFPSSIGLLGGSEPSDPSGGISLENPHWAVNLPAAVGQGAGGALGLQLGSVGGAANLALRLSAAEENGDVKIISSPRVSTLDNRKASISQGVSIPISVVSAAGVNTQFFSADLSLDVEPHVTRDGHVNLKIDISKNEPDFGNVAANGNPTIQKKEAHTELLIRDGDTTVIGGIYTRSTSKSFKKIPLLGDIPVLGWLFKSRTRSDDRSELLIFITPKIVNREVAL